MPEKTNIHGFHGEGLVGWVNFIKATIWLGSTVAAIVVVSLAFAFDRRYAPLSVVDQINANGASSLELKASVREVGHQIAGLRLAQLQEQIFLVRSQQCAATTTDSRAFFARRLQALLSEHRDLTGDAADLPDCTDLR